MGNAHALEDYFTEEEAKRVRGAAAMAICTGSRGSSERREFRSLDGKLHSAEEVSVTRIEGQAFKVTSHQGMVIVMPSRPGRFVSHRAPLASCGYCGEIGGCDSMGRGQHHWA